MNISLVIPLLNEEESLPELSAWIQKVMDENSFSYEILYIDDGSSDESWKVILELAEKNPAIKGISFRRNYGKSAALNVGFAEAKGDVVITMDADLQDSPNEIPELYRLIKEEHFHLISGWKKKRHDPLSKTIPTKFFNWVTRKVSGIYLHDFNCGLKAYHHDVVKSVEVYGEMHRYIPVIAKWAGFTCIGEKVVQHQPRQYGTTKFGFERFINGFLDLLSITFMSRFSKRPMHFFGLIGTLCFLIGFFVALWLILEKVMYAWFLMEKARGVTDQPLFYLALVAVVVGTQLFLAGFLGELISRSSTSRNYYHIKDRVH
ncbi:MAG: glycosyltransferase family 2 protein [Bacteroidia bacterium]